MTLCDELRQFYGCLRVNTGSRHESRRTPSYRTRTAPILSDEGNSEISTVAFRISTTADTMKALGGQERGGRDDAMDYRTVLGRYHCRSYVPSGLEMARVDGIDNR